MIKIDYITDDDTKFLILQSLFEGKDQGSNFGLGIIRGVNAFDYKSEHANRFYEMRDNAAKNLKNKMKKDNDDSEDYDDKSEDYNDRSYQKYKDDDDSDDTINKPNKQKIGKVSNLYNRKKENNNEYEYKGRNENI